MHDAESRRTTRRQAVSGTGSRLLPALALVAGLASSAGGAAPAATAEPEVEPSTPRLSLTPHTFTANDGKEVEAELGWLTVPMRRGSDSDATVELVFVRFPATTERPGPPIVYLAGGPGGSGIDAARGSRFPLFMALRDVADVIALDQRGTGDSMPALACEERYLLPFDRPVDPSTAGPKLAETAAACAERLAGEGIDLDGYTTPESAADLEDLRRALGAEKLALWGISYGTHLALATMRAYPESIDRAILAGVEPLHHTLKLPADQQALLEEIARRVAADPAVAAAVPDLLGSIGRLLDGLAETPQVVELRHPLNGMAIRVALGPWDLQALLASMLRGPSDFARMPDLVARLEGGDWTALALLAGTSRTGPIGSGMSLAMDCASGASEAWLERIERQTGPTLLADAINFPFPEICEGVPVRDLGDDFRAPFRSDVPTLAISGTLDGRTPPANAEEILPLLSAGHHLVLTGAGHSDPLFLSSPRILEAMELFLGGRPVPWAEIEVEVPGFVPPREIAEVPAETLERYTGAYRIAEGDVRRVLLAGDVLYTVRGENGRPFPLRPLSDTRFFYEASSTWLEFELDEAGRPTAMVVHHDGSEEGERAIKVE